MIATKPRYSASKGGHAPGHLRELLIGVLENGAEHWWDNLATPDADEAIPGRKGDAWRNMDAKQRARWLLGQLWNCSDILPGNVYSDEGLEGKQTYAVLARKLMADFD